MAVFHKWQPRMLALWGLMVLLLLSGQVLAEPENRLIQYGNQKLSELRVEGQSIQLNNCEVTGPLVADMVVLRSSSKVYGPITARRLDATSGSARGGIKADSISLLGTEVIGNVETRDIVVGRGSRITGNIIAPGGTVMIEEGGEVLGDVEAGRLTLGTGVIIRGAAKAGSGGITLGTGARISGKITGPSDGITLVLPETRWAVEGPELRMEGGPQIVYRDSHPFSLGTALGMWLPVLFGMLSLCAILFAFFAYDVETVADGILDTPLRFLWVGIVSMILTGATIFLLLITIIGIPVAFAAAITAVLTGALGITGVSMAIGAKVVPLINREIHLSPFLQLLAGVFLVTHLAWIPVIGWLLLAALMIIGYGAAFSIWWPRIKGWWSEYRRSRREKKLLRR